jgi:hypothetical protein
MGLAAGAASLASAFPSLRQHMLALSLAGLIVITAVNLRGIAERRVSSCCSPGDLAGLRCLIIEVFC